LSASTELLSTLYSFKNKRICEIPHITLILSRERLSLRISATPELLI